MLKDDLAGLVLVTLTAVLAVLVLGGAQQAADRVRTENMLETDIDEAVLQELDRYFGGGTEYRKVAYEDRIFYLVPERSLAVKFVTGVRG